MERQRFAAQHGLKWDNALRLETISVRRASHQVTATDIAAQISDLIVAETGASKLDVTMNQTRLVLHLPVDGADALSVDLVSLDRRTGRYEAEIDAGLARPMRVTGQAVEVLEVPVLARAFERGQMIGERDITWLDQRIDRIGANVVTNADELVGMAAKRPLRAGALLNKTDFARPLAVKKGALVTMTFEAPGMVLSDTGRAVEQGSVGDIIGVLNPRSRRTVYGTITAPDTIAVDSGNAGRPRQQAALSR